MKQFILGALTVLVVGVVVFGAYSYGKSSGTVARTASPSPSAEALTTPQTNPQTQLVGNDRDEHGCIPTAGYSWCESKQKCYRSFEEGCQTSEDNDLIRAALFQKNDWKDNDGITVTVSTNDGKYASGTVTAQGGGGYFYAVKNDDSAWEIVADGNGMIECSTLEKYPDYPNTLISSCYVPSTEEIVKR